MRSLLIPIVLLAAGVQLVSGQQAQRVPPDIYREPLVGNRPATAVEPARGLPLQFGHATLRLSPDFAPRGRSPILQTELSSRTVRTVPVSGITLRVAFGPTRHGMITFRLRPFLGPEPATEPFAQITPNGSPRRVEFMIADEDPPPGYLALTRDMRIVFTLDRLEGDEGQLIFENPDATELLWEALGRPSLSTQ